MQAELDPAVVAELFRFYGDDGARELIGAYLNDSPAQLRAMQDALARDDAAGLSRAAHQLKSTSAMVGAAELATLCRRLEFGAGGDDQRALLAEADRRYRNVRAELTAALPAGERPSPTR